MADDTSALAPDLLSMPQALWITGGDLSRTEGTRLPQRSCSAAYRLRGRI